MSNKISWLAGCGVLLTLLGAGCNSTGTTTAPLATGNNSQIPPSSTTASNTNATVASATIKIPAKKPAAAVPASKSYTDLLAIYKTSGYYFAFVDCHALPGVLSFKKGVTFMLDNRDTAKRTIAVNGVPYSLAPYGYAIAMAPGKPGSYYITCDGGGAAQVNIQQ